MIIANTHIIRKQTVEINFETMEGGVGMQNRLASLFYERLQPGMEILFDEMADANHAAVIDSLEIDCGILLEKNWEEDWVNAVLRKLREKLLSVNKQQLSADKITGDFFYFMEHGLLPWNSNVKSVQVFEENIVFDTAFLGLLQEKMNQQNILQRLLNQFSENFIATLVKALLIENGKEIDEQILYAAAINQPVLSRNQQEMILKACIKQKNRPAGANGKATIKKIGNDAAKKNIDKDPSTAIFINNAGLVILHPFLPALFEHLQLVQNNNWISEEAQHRAVAVTAFLVTGETRMPEFNLALNKFLCGLQTTDVLLQADEIDSHTQQACEEMQQEVIKHWSSLKNTGVASFRETFLQREGKLSNTDNGRLLQVEQKAVDVLLNTLPWGIGVIKLPWMKEILHTEWNG
jgi:Contractile injection system tape measure protein